MENQDFTISISTFKEAPLVTVVGTADACRAETLEDVMEGLFLDGAEDIALDVTEASFADIESTSILIRMLRMVSREVQVVVAAYPKLSATIRHAGLAPYLTICSSLADPYEGDRQNGKFLTSRWIAHHIDDEELPLAA